MGTITKERATARDEAREILAGILWEGQTVYTVLRHVSSSGMSRRISVFVVVGDTLRDITYLTALAFGDKPSEWRGRWALRVNGAGMDMGFHVVDSLSWAVFGRGYAVRHEWA